MSPSHVAEAVAVEVVQRHARLGGAGEREDVAVVAVGPASHDARVAIAKATGAEA